jgi:hypothetical protein
MQYTSTQLVKSRQFNRLYIASIIVSEVFSIVKSRLHILLQKMLAYAPAVRIWSSKALLVVCFVLFAAAFVFWGTKLVDSRTAAALMGVIIGAVVSAATSILLAWENQFFQLRTAALEKRLAIHQAAYALWWKIVSAVHDREKIDDVVIEAYEWWKNNCLYLDAASRKAFRVCVASAHNHKDLLAGPRSKESAKLIQDNWDQIMKPGQTLVEGVALPSLGEYEKPSGI